MKKIIFSIVFVLTCISSYAVCTGNAGPDQSVCHFSVVTMAGHGGAGTWTNAANNLDSIIFSNRTDSSATATGFNHGGTYSLIWTTNGCPDTVKITVKAPNAGPDQGICLGVQINLAAAPLVAPNTGRWSKLPTNPANITIPINTSATSVARGFNVYGLYGFIWTTQGCADTMYVNVHPKPDAGPDRTIDCFLTGDTILVAVDTPGVWSAFGRNPGSAHIQSPTHRTTVIDSFSGFGNFYFLYTVNGCSDTAKINVGTNCHRLSTGCPTVQAGTLSARGDTTLDCGTNCTLITAQYFNTGNTSTYEVAPIPYQPPFPFNVGSTILVRTDDRWSSVIALPFNFCFFGNTYNSIIVGSNGVVSFNTANANGGNSWAIPGPIPFANPADIHNSILCPWEDTDPTNLGNIYYSIGGVYPCRYFTVTYDSIPYFGDPNSVSTASCGRPMWASSQMVMYETTNVIEIYIRQKETCGGWNGGQCIEGIQNANGTQAYVVPGRNAPTQWNASNDAWRFTPNGPSIVDVKWMDASFHTLDSAAGDSTQKLSVTVCPPSSTIIPVATTYIAQSTYHRCDGTTVIEIDSMRVITTPLPTAGPDQYISCIYANDSILMSGVNHAGYRWTQLASNPSVVTFDDVTSAYTPVRGFTQLGVYSFVYGSAVCGDTMQVTVLSKPIAGPDQNICQYDTTRLGSLGIGIWSPIGSPANPSIVMFRDSSSDSTSVKGFTSPGTYSFVWTSNGCTDTMNVIVTAKPDAGSDQTICLHTSAIMAGVDTGVWTPRAGNPDTTTITNPSLATTTITGFDSIGVYGYVWTVHGCTDTVLIAVINRPDAGPDQNVCVTSGSTSMAAAGTGIWSALPSNPSGANIVNPLSAATTITGMTTLGAIYYFQWTIPSGCADTVAITVISRPNPGPDQIICQNATATMAAVGNGVWQASSTNPGVTTITNTTSPTTTVTGLTVAGIYGFIWTVGQCNDIIHITVNPIPDAGPDQTICQYTSTNMAAVGVGQWSSLPANPGAVTFSNSNSPTSPVSGFNFAGTYGFVWTVGGCTDTMYINVTAKPNAGPDDTICQYTTATMAGRGAGGTWSAMAGNPAAAVITVPSDSATTVTGFTAFGIYHFIWTISGCTDTMTINVTAKPDPGLDQTICQYFTTNLAGVGTGVWTTQAGNPSTASITSPSANNTTVSGLDSSGIYVFVWTVNGCNATVNITVTPKPDAGADQTICQYTDATMTAGGAAGTWTAYPTNPAAVTFGNTTSPTTTVSGFSASGIYTFIWSVNGCDDTMNINVTAKPDAGGDHAVCQYFGINLTGMGPGAWSGQSNNPSTATITTPGSPTTSVTGLDSAGTYNFIWTNNGCTDTMSVFVTAKPDAGVDQTICQYTDATMAAGGVVGTWTAYGTNPAAVSFANNTSPISTVSGFTLSGIYSFIWSVNGCEDTMNINVTAKPDAGGDQTVCQNSTVTMAGIGSGVWSAQAGNPGSAGISTPSSATTTITGLSTIGLYNFVWTVNGCTDTMTINVAGTPSIILRDTAICIGNSATLTPDAQPAGGTYLWNTGATTPTITISPAATTGYTVTYSIGICNAIDSNTVTINPLPVVSVTTDTTICTANIGTAIANVTVGAVPYTYLWTGGLTTDTITHLAAGAYSVTVTDANGCQASAGGTVPIITPTVAVTLDWQHNLRCNNDTSGEIHIHTTPIDTGAVIYNWSDGSHNQNLTHVQIGAYTVNVTDGYGCTGTGTYLITQPPLLLAGVPSHIDPTCFGATNGSATTSPSGGSGAYSYNWNTAPAQQTQTASGLSANTYYLTVSDDSNCHAYDTVTLVNPPAIGFGDSIIVEPSCHDGHDGTAQAVPQNGVGAYTYQWNLAANNQTTNPATGLAAGTYVVTATDANGCQGTQTIIVGEPAAIDVSVTPENITCHGYSNGSATATGSGGTLPYTFSWSNGQTSATATGLSPITYTVIITDSKGCHTSATTSITQPDAVQDTLLTSVRTHCPGSSDGSVTVLSKGGTGAITYSVKDAGGVVLQSNASGIFNGLSSQTYTIISTDSNGCFNTDTITVPSPEFNIYTSYADSTSCYGTQYKDGIIHVQGHTIPNGPYQFSVDGSAFQAIPDFFDMSAGSHSVTARDNYGCDTTFTVTVGAPLPAAVQILPGDSTLTAGANLQLSTMFGPYPSTSIISYYWTPSTGLSCIDCPNPVVSPYTSQTTYTLVVTYNKGCTTSGMIQISVDGQPPIYVPDAFTPNGDGNNDFFSAYGVGIRDIHMTVFNRWGEKVFESTNQSDGWDGTYQGQLQPTGVYIYYLEATYLTDKKITRQGSLTLIR